jgi:hypothetical protein
VTRTFPQVTTRTLVHRRGKRRFERVSWPLVTKPRQIGWDTGIETYTSLCRDHSYGSILIVPERKQYFRWLNRDIFFFSPRRTRALRTSFWAVAEKTQRGEKEFKSHPSFFILFFAVLGLELRVYTSTPRATPQPFFCDFFFFRDKASQTIAQAGFKLLSS